MFENNFDKAYLFDGDTIEFMTQNFYKATIQGVVDELTRVKKNFMRALNSLPREGILKTYLVEIKPDAQTQPPKYPGKQTKKYLTESMTFMKNQSKWSAAKQYASDRGWEFIILTEKHLF